jgi:Zn-dependent membrane protease YugP
MWFDVQYFLWVAPALLLAVWAQLRVKSAYAQAGRVPARLSGAAAARHILDAAGLHDVGIEQIGGHLSDHYDPRQKVLRLSTEVYRDTSAAAVGIAAHEAGHALQDAHRYAPLVVRNAAVPVASLGGNASMWILMAGILMQMQPLVLLGIAAFGCVVAFQLINLPVEFDASHRAKRLLAEYGIVGDQEMVYVNKVLNAAAWTYVAGTLQALLTLLYYATRYGGGSDE